VDVTPNDLGAHMLAVNSQPLAISLDASDFHNYHSGVLTFEVGRRRREGGREGDMKRGEAEMHQ